MLLQSSLVVRGVVIIADENSAAAGKPRLVAELLTAVAVEMLVARHPPHRSVRALLTHTAPALGSASRVNAIANKPAVVGDCLRRREPGVT